MVPISGPTGAVGKARIALYLEDKGIAAGRRPQQAQAPAFKSNPKHSATQPVKKTSEDDAKYKAVYELELWK